MKIATIICNHNYGEYVSGSIDSALNQTVDNHVFVIDDASTDNSMEVLLTYKNNPRVNILATKSPVGPAEARNILIEEAMKYNFDIFAILDADDRMYPNKLEICTNKLLSNDIIGSVYADYDILSVEDGSLIREYKEPFCRLRLKENCIVHSGSVIKKQALISVKNENGFYNRTMRTCEDYELWVRISKQMMIVHIPQSLTFVRNHSRNSTNTVPNEIWQENWRKVAEAYA